MEQQWLRKLPRQANAGIRTAVSTELTDLAQARNVTALVNHEYGYRLRSLLFQGGFAGCLRGDWHILIWSFDGVSA